MATKFKVSSVIPTSPMAIYDAWLDSKQRGAMTGGGKAKASKKIGAPFTSFGGYSFGANLELEPGKRIVQSWRSTDFAAGDPDSTIEVTLSAVPSGTRLSLLHNGIPEGQDDYKEGWKEFYFGPMKAYFAAMKPVKKPAARKATRPAKKTAKKKAAAKK
jgi:activator of HSP90 ATPase